MVKKTTTMTRPKAGAQTRPISRGPATISKPSTGRGQLTTPGFKPKPGAGLKKKTY